MKQITIEYTENDVRLMRLSANYFFYTRYNKCVFEAAFDEGVPDPAFFPPTDCDRDEMCDWPECDCGKMPIEAIPIITSSSI